MALNIQLSVQTQRFSSSLFREYLKAELTRLNWYVEEDQFETTTLAGDRVTFSNVLATKWPTSPRRLVLGMEGDEASPCRLEQVIKN